jgi:tetratricopeptide (TPR) repeat protein
MEKAHPDLDLRPEYRRLLEELKGNPDAVYLLARLEDLDQGDRLFRQAAEGPNPSRFALHALGHQALSEGQFTQAVTWMEKSSRMAPENPQVWQDFKLSLLASRQYDRLLQELEKQPKTGANHLANDADRIRALAGKGDKVAARAVIDEATRLSPGPEAAPYVQMMRAFLEMTWCCQEKDAAGYLKWAAQFPEQTRFESALLKGDLEAASKVETEYYRTIGPALLYLAALKAGDQKRADQIWSQLMASLDKSDRYSRQLSAMLTGRQPVTLPALRRLPMHALHKRVLLVVAAKRFPDLSKDLISLARQLDFYADATSLCLAKVMDKDDSEQD